MVIDVLDGPVRKERVCAPGDHDPKIDHVARVEQVQRFDRRAGGDARAERLFDPQLVAQFVLPDQDDLDQFLRVRFKVEQLADQLELLAGLQDIVETG